MKYLIAIFVLWMTVPLAQACSCARWTPDEQRNRAALVFAGRIEQVTLIDAEAMWEPRIVVRFSVGRVWKGQVPATLTMHTFFEASSCRGFFRSIARPGDELLVFATAGNGKAWKTQVDAFGDQQVGKVLRQDVVDALPDDARIYTTSICSGTQRWQDADLDMRTLGPYRIPKGATAMKDPAPFDDTSLAPELREIPQVCWTMRGERDWKVLDSPPGEGADFEHQLRRTVEYKKVMSGSIGQAKDFWWRDEQTGATGLCRLMHPDPRQCGALGAILEDGKIVYAVSDPCAGGPM